MKGQGDQAALLTGSLTRQVAAAGDRRNVLTVGTYCYVAVCRLGGARRFGAHRGSTGAGAYCGGRPPTGCITFAYTTFKEDDFFTTLDLHLADVEVVH